MPAIDSPPYSASQSVTRGGASTPRRMPLGRKILLINLSLILALSILGITLARSIHNMRVAVSAAADEYTELQLVERAVYHSAMAKSELADGDDGSADAVDELVQALDQLQRFREFQHHQSEASSEHQRGELSKAALADTTLRAVLEQIRFMRESGPADFEHIEMIDVALHHLSELASDTDIAGARAATSERTTTALVVVAVAAGFVVLGAVFASAISYWSVMSPLTRLHAGVRRVADGAFDERLDEGGNREFAELAADFNLMAGELSNLYADLESKVKAKSGELVRSERLASVGFLAAGVAHEINNPLNIMSGYAEMAQSWLDRAGREGDFTDVREALEIIRQEAFRCKDITGKLLSLAAADDSSRADVSVPRLCNEVVAMVSGLRKYREHAVIIDVEAKADQPVLAGAAEIKQVLLNLVINALEAYPTSGGEVRLLCRATPTCIEVVVSDHGSGMTAEVLERVFEPFFTTRRGSGSAMPRGVGLGLSISHAIILSHGGRIRAESDGPGCGSRFIIELPIHRERPKEGASHAASPVSAS